MAKRPSVKEILEAARRGGPARPTEGEGTAAEAPEQPTAEAAPEPVVQAKTPATPPPNVPTPSQLGRPLTLKEKLAAARAGGSTPAVSAPAAKAAEPAAAEPAAVEPAAAPTAPRADIPTPAKLGRPLTLQEKLAAARANAAAAPSAGSAKPAAAAVAKTATKRELPPLDKITDPKDLAEALRQTGAKKDQEVAAAKAKEAPVKPAKEKEKKPESVLPRPAKGAVHSGAGETATLQTRRRGFLLSATAIIWIAWGAFLFGVTAFTAMLGRFMFPNVLAEPPSTIKIGLPTTYDPEAVNERFKAEWGFWVVRSTRVDGQDIIYALQSVCTHLGCPPNWLSGEQKFKCPCHGSGFYISGINFEGPAPRPLERFKVTLADDGQITVDKSQKFQQELGQWSDPDSFITA